MVGSAEGGEGGRCFWREGAFLFGGKECGDRVFVDAKLLPRGERSCGMREIWINIVCYILALYIIAMV